MLSRFFILKYFSQFQTLPDRRRLDCQNQHGWCQILLPREISNLSTCLDVPRVFAEEVQGQELGSQRYVEFCYLRLGVGHKRDPIQRPVTHGMRNENRTGRTKSENPTRNFASSEQVDHDLHEWGSWKATQVWYDRSDFGQNEALMNCTVTFNTSKILTMLLYCYVPYCY